MNFQFLCKDAGLKTVEEIANFFEVTERTVKNWKKGKPPRAVFLCLKIMSGDLSILHKNWKGFKLTPDVIISPDKEFIYHYEVKAIRYVYQAAGIERSKICNMLSKQNATKPPLYETASPIPPEHSNVVSLQIKRG